MVSNLRARVLESYFFFFIAATYLPLALLVLFSFNDSLLVGFPWAGFTLRWWELFFQSKTAIDCVKNSLVLASFTALTATSVGLPAAFALVRKHGFRGEGFLTQSMIAVIALPAILTGVGLLSFLRGLLNVELSLFTIWLAHVLISLPYVVLTLMARLIGFDISLEEAAMDLGANEFTTFRRITFPLIIPGILSGLFMAFTLSIEDVILAHFLAGREQTAPIFIYGQLRRWTGLPVVMALSAFMIMIALALAVIFAFMERKRA